MGIELYGQYIADVLDLWSDFSEKDSEYSNSDESEKDEETGWEKVIT